MNMNNNFFAFHYSNDHLVVSGSLLNIFTFTLKTNNYQNGWYEKVSVLCILNNFFATMYKKAPTSLLLRRKETFLRSDCGQYE